MTTTNVLLLPAAIFKKLLDTYPERQTFVYTLLSCQLTVIMTLLEEVLFNRLHNRLLDYLIECAEDIVVSRTHQNIVNDLGTSLEVISRLLKDLQER